MLKLPPPGTLQTTFWMEDLTQIETQLGPLFFPKSGYFFLFSKKGREGLPRICAPVFVFGIFNFHHKNWQTYSGRTDRPSELCYNFLQIFFTNLKWPNSYG